MDFNGFKERFLANLEMLKDKDCEVLVKERCKNNGLVLTGVSLSYPDMICVPTIYLEHLYENYKNGATVIDLVNEYLLLFERSKNMNLPDMSFVDDLDAAKRIIMCKVINTEMNRELLKDIPNIPFLNLSIVFFVMTKVYSDSFSSVLIDNSVFENWNISVSELYQFAFKNTMDFFKTTVRGIDEVLLDLIARQSGNEDGEIDELAEKIGAMQPSERPGMYVLTNNSGINGAVGILDTSSLNKFADKIEGDFYILPSSIHELILVPKENTDSSEALREMVREVNTNEVEPQDVLSDSVYLFDRKKQCVCYA